MTIISAKHKASRRAFLQGRLDQFPDRSSHCAKYSHAHCGGTRGRGPDAHPCMCPCHPHPGAKGPKWKPSAPYIPHAEKTRADHAKFRAMRRESYRTIRDKLRTMLGGVCNMCGSADSDALRFHHRAGDGSRCRADHGPSSNKHITWHVQQGPGHANDTLQLLCHLCHFEKAHMGYWRNTPL